jgi:hypothetical protein
MHRTIGGILIILTLAALTGSGRSAAEGMTPSERAVSTSKGQLKSPYSDFASVAEDGGGGGGMAAPLTNPVWIYGEPAAMYLRWPYSDAPIARPPSLSPRLPWG